MAKTKEIAKDRRCQVLVGRTPDHPAIVQLQVGGESDLYLVADLPCDVSGHRLFELVRYRHELRGHESAVARYSTLVADPQAGAPVRGSCDCPGGTYRPDEPCRHVAFLSVLWRRGTL